MEKSYEETNKKPTADDDIVGNGLTLSEKDCITYDNTTNQKHVRNSRVAQGFFEVIMIAFKRKPRTTTCNNPHAVTHTAKSVARTLRIVSKRKSRMYLEKISLDL